MSFNNVLLLNPRARDIAVRGGHTFCMVARYKPRSTALVFKCFGVQKLMCVKQFAVQKSLCVDCLCVDFLCVNAFVCKSVLLRVTSHGKKHLSLNVLACESLCV